MFSLEISRMSTIFATFFSRRKGKKVHLNGLLSLKQQYISADIQRSSLGSEMRFSRGLTLGFALFYIKIVDAAAEETWAGK